MSSSETAINMKNITADENIR